ncbi:hypothetical protein [Nocardia farcinica]|uniref:hypothetical protein n=1 Tax=Nocardia farcinica TaxID=37329 RepID=UPI001E3C2706|nr:hypothetical protein [Nocardia farcinica]UEX20730.1 hypothetical protein LMJ57_17005 [Nocardia farcinica]
MQQSRDLDPHLNGLPEAVVGAARDNIAGAQLVATGLPDPAGADLTATSAHAYTEAISAVFLASAAVSALLAAAIAAKLPKQTPSPGRTSPAPSPR